MDYNDANANHHFRKPSRIESLVGKHGSNEHEELVNRVRWTAARWVHIDYPEALVLADEKLMQWTLGERRSGGRIPDVLFEMPEGFVVVEIGKVNPDKWPEIPMVHVGFGGHVSVVCAHPAPHAHSVAEAIRRALQAEEGAA